MWLFHLRCNSFTSTVWWEYGLFLQLFAGGLHAWVRLLVIPLEFQKTRHQPFPYNTAFLYGSVIVCGCFISTVRWKIQPFSPVFPSAGSSAKAFFRLSLWSFKEKDINHFYNTAFYIILYAPVCAGAPPLCHTSITVSFNLWYVHGPLPHSSATRARQIVFCPFTVSFRIAVETG